MFFRNKVRFFVKTKSFSNLSLSVLFIFSFLLIIFNKTDYLLVNKIKSLGVDVITPITSAVTFPVRVSTSAIQNFNEFRYLKNENLKLKEELKRLKKWQILAIKNESENIAYKKLLNSTSTNIKIVKTASVISQTPELYSKMITINAGTNHGVLNDMTIVNERGLIGKIISTSKNNSKAILINDPNSSIPVKTLENNFFAVVSGDGKYLKSSFIKGDSKPKVGDLVLTSGSTKTYPRDILVGKVIKVSDDNFVILPYVNFDDLGFVQVVNLQ